MDPTLRARSRGRIRKQVVQCANCQLHDLLPESCTPVPPTFPREPLFAVLSDSPGSEEVRRGLPGVGGPGKLLRSVLRRVGFDDREEVAWLKTVGCFPHMPIEDSKRVRPRPPSDDEMRACRGNLTASLDATDVEFILLVGATSLRAFRTDLTLADVHGQVFVWQGRWVVMPVWHPSAILRDDDLRDRWVRDLKRWAWIVSGEGDPLAEPWERCGSDKCNWIALWWDRDGVGYCANHQRKGMKEWGRQQTVWTQGAKVKKGAPIPGQGEML